MHSITYIFSDADIDHIIDIDLKSYFYVLLCELLLLMLMPLLKQNVLLSSPQSDAVLKIADFGLSR